MNFLSRDFSPLKNVVFFAIKSINFDRELLSSQTTHRNGILFLESVEYRLISVGHLWAKQFKKLSWGLRGTPPIDSGEKKPDSNRVNPPNFV